MLLILMPFTLCRSSDFKPIPKFQQGCLVRSCSSAYKREFWGRLLAETHQIEAKYCFKREVLELQ